jgi:hypothetical protein
MAWWIGPLGAYSRPHIAEAILGVTRTMLTRPPLPLFLSC